MRRLAGISSTISSTSGAPSRGATSRTVSTDAAASRPALNRKTAKRTAASKGYTNVSPLRAKVQARAQGLGQLAKNDPDAAKRMVAAGQVLARAQGLGLGAAAGNLAGPAGGGLISGSNRGYSGSGGKGGDGYDSYYYGGYGYYGHHFSLSFGYWGCNWWGWPYYCSYYYPYWCSSYYSWWYTPHYYGYYPYYPGYQSTVVYHHYYGDDDVVYVTEEEPVQEYVGEGAVVDDEPYEVGPRRASSLSTAAERYLTLGDRAFREGRYADAVQFYAKAVEFAPQEGVLHLILADALFATGDYHYAAYAIRRALELDPALAGAIVDKHAFYPDPEELDRQIARLEIFLEENPADQDARLVLATNYLFAARPAAAVDLQESSLALPLRTDSAANLILESARKVQYGAEEAVEVEVGVK
ncbi:MAG: hypothetical protein O7B99_04560 [Planctomycetota bacterium]|nr:hypothetical protein [Planctomycetota bacterium]